LRFTSNFDFPAWGNVWGKSFKPNKQEHYCVVLEKAGWGGVVRNFNIEHKKIIIKYEKIYKNRNS
jgi:hypothetical protein